MAKEIKVKGLRQDDLSALLEAGPRTSAGSTVKERRSLAGKRAIRQGDKRRVEPELKRDKQLNVNISLELQTMINDLARQENVSKAELIDRAIKVFAKHPKDYK